MARRGLRAVLGEEKIEPEVVENMRSWPGHRRAAMVGGFSVDQSVLLSAGDQPGIERLVQYMTRCPFSLSRLVKVSDTGQVVYQVDTAAGQHSCSNTRSITFQQLKRDGGIAL